MSTGTPRTSVTRQLQVLRTEMAELRTELKGDIAALRVEMIDRIGGVIDRVSVVHDRVGVVNDRVSSLAQEFVHFKGVMIGVGIALTTVIPVLTFLLNKLFR